MTSIKASLLITLFLTTITLIKAKSTEICSVCNCNLVKITHESRVLADDQKLDKISFNYRTDIVGQFINAQNISTSDKYLYMDCSADENVGHLDNLDWPNAYFLGVYGNFRRSKWKTIETFPKFIRPQMVKLSLAENLIKDIAAAELEGFSQLKMFNLTQNLITSINKTTFQGIYSLLKLDLSQNKINKLESLAFYTLTDLTFLNLSRNEISYLEKDAFSGNGNLAVLDLSFNELAKLPEEFKNNVKFLKSLHIKNNALEWVPELPKNLTLLDISDNHLTSLNLGITDLEYLDVSNNQLISIDEAFQLYNLKVLRAKNNSIATLPHVNSRELRILDVGYNKLQIIPDVISSDMLPKLQELYLDGNPISLIQFSGQSAPFLNLQIIGLSFLGKVESLHRSSFSGIFYEKVLNCSEDNKFPSINISHNQIKQIDEDAFTGSSICSIDLSNNQLRTLSKKILPWRKLSYINLQHNPWQCDCDLQWFLSDLMPYLFVYAPEQLYELRCAAPKRFADKVIVYWYQDKNEVFCKGPSAFYVDSFGGNVIEIWTVSMIICVILSCIIFITLITIIVLVCTKPKKRREITRQKNIRRVFRDYKEVRSTIDDKV